MADMKRGKSEWGFEDVLLDRPTGTGMESIQLDADTLLLHISVPDHWEKGQVERVSKWGERLKKKLPENTFLIVTIGKFGKS
jgi:hypothetical protein